MKFSIIYEANCGSEDRIADFAPPHVRRRVKGQRVWELTESSDHYDDDPSLSKHRKWCAILTAKQFREFIDATDMEAEDVETMGSVGAPGFGISAVPAICFRGTDEYAYRNAYVTPFPDRLLALREKKGNEEGWTDKDWNRIRAAVMRAYGDWHAQRHYAIKGELQTA